MARLNGNKKAFIEAYLVFFLVDNLQWTLISWYPNIPLSIHRWMNKWRKARNDCVSLPWSLLGNLTQGSLGTSPFQIAPPPSLPPWNCTNNVTSYLNYATIVTYFPWKVEPIPSHLRSKTVVTTHFIFSFRPEITRLHHHLPWSCVFIPAASYYPRPASSSLISTM